MIHLTLTTGHTRFSPRDEVEQSVLDLVAAILDPLRDHDRYALPLPEPLSGYRLALDRTRTALEATVLMRARGIARIKIAPDARAESYLWPGISRRFPNIQKPESTPWCTAELLPEIVHHPDAIGWLGDFERCLAWAWVDFLKGQQ